MRQATVDTGIVDHLGHQTGPTTLMAGTETSAAVAVEELVKPQVVLPVRVKVEHVVAVVDGTSSVIATSHKMLKTVLNLFGNMSKVHLVA